MRNHLLILFVFSYFISNTYQLEETNTITIELEVSGFRDGNTVGKKGAISLYFYYKTSTRINFEKDCEEKTKFETRISNKNNKNYKINCRFWNSIIFCNVNENVPAGEYTINLNSTTLTYNNYSIFILQDNDLSFTKLDENIIQLYSEEQTINVENKKESYELMVKINSYNGETIYLYKGHYCVKPLNCKAENGELKCIMPKSLLDEITEKNNDTFGIGHLDSNNDISRFDLVPKITINYLQTHKQRIYINITKLIENITDYNSFVAYETNIDYIAEVTSELEKFDLSFGYSTFKCGLKKYDNYPLLLLCKVNKEGTFSLSKIEKRITLKDISIRYEFEINPVTNNQKFYCKNKLDTDYRYINFVVPSVLNYTSTDSLKIEYYFNKKPNNIKGLTFNQNSSDLVCEQDGKKMTCIVPMSHFEGKDGYYFLMHQNHLNGKSYSYESPPIKVILPDPNAKKNTDNTLIIIISIMGGIIILVVIIFLICFCRKKVNSSDIEVGKETSDIGL